jgi:phosphoribosylformimino-5-aminoimidazole carboxamide ribotide isomerase
VRELTGKAVTRVGGGVRTPESAAALIAAGASKVIVGTAAFPATASTSPCCGPSMQAVGRDAVLLALDSKDGRITIKGWQEAIDLTAEEVIARLEPHCGGFLCTYVDKEGMLQGTDLDWYKRLRSATNHEITAAGGITTLDDIRALAELNVHAALGMAIYTGRLDLAELAEMNKRLA